MVAMVPELTPVLYFLCIRNEVLQKTVLVGFAVPICKYQLSSHQSDFLEILYWTVLPKFVDVS
jgi:hypothetical protein